MHGEREREREREREIEREGEREALDLYGLFEAAASQSSPLSPHFFDMRENARTQAACTHIAHTLTF